MNNTTTYILAIVLSGGITICATCAIIILKEFITFKSTIYEFLIKFYRKDNNSCKVEKTN